jgi:hypothetical protein
MHFDAREAKALQAGSTIVVQGCPGLRLEASKAGKSWIYRYKSPIDSRMRQIKLGAWPALPIASAAARWEELKSQRDAGRDPSLERKADRAGKATLAKVKKEGVYTVARLLDDYLANYIDKQRDPKNAHALRSRLTRGVASIAHLEPAHVTRSIAFDTIQALSEWPVMANSVRQELGGAWEYAHDSGRLSEDVPNWWRSIMKRKLQSKGQMRDGERKGTDKRVLAENEVGALVVTDFPLLSPAIQDVLTLYLWTCSRGGEICALHADHITEEGGVLWATLPKSQTKNQNRERATDFRIPLVGRAESVVRRRVAENPGGYLFPGRHSSGHIQQTNVQTQVHSRQPYSRTRPDWERTRLTVTHWSPHDLRRTGRTLLAKMGCPDEVGEAILGHVTPGVAGIYNRYRYDAEKLQWLQQLADRLEEIVHAAGHAES